MDVKRQYMPTGGVKLLSIKGGRIPPPNIFKSFVGLPLGVALSLIANKLMIIINFRGFGPLRNSRPDQKRSPRPGANFIENLTIFYHGQIQ